MNPRPKSVVQEICTLRSVGGGGRRLPPPTRWMAVFATAQFAGLAVGSIVWGQAAQMIGLPAVHIIAAIALVASVPLLQHWRLQTAAGLDLAPSMHWPTPLLSHDIEPTEVRCW